MGVSNGRITGREGTGEEARLAAISESLRAGETVEAIAGVLIAWNGAFVTHREGLAVLTDRRVLVFSARGGYSMWEGTVALRRLTPLARKLLPAKPPELRFAAARPCTVKKRGGVQDMEFNGECRVVFRSGEDAKAFAGAWDGA